MWIGHNKLFMEVNRENPKKKKKKKTKHNERKLHDFNSYAWIVANLKRMTVILDTGNH